MLRLEQVSMYYYNGGSVAVGIRAVNLAFRRGEFVLITGESGSGKSSLLSVLSFLRPYHDGEVYLYGKPTSAFDEGDREGCRREHIGFVFQSYNLIDSYTALENVASAMLIQGLPAHDARRRAAVYLARVGLSGMEDRRASKLSSGQKQRLSIARALAKETDILVADEPTGNLDSENGRQIVELLADIARDKLVLMVSHNIEEAEPYATRRIRLHDGSVVADEALRLSEAPVRQDAAHSDREGDAAAEPPQSAAAERSAKRRGARALALRFARFNLAAQPKKTLLILAFLFLSAAASFVFLGAFLEAMDDTPAKIYDDSAFKNGDVTRIVVRRADGAALTQADHRFFTSVRNVAQVDLYDYVNDCNYYHVYDTDYYRAYNLIDIKQGAEVVKTVRVSSVLFLQDQNYLRTATCLTDASLAAGRLPEAVNEIAFYSRDPDALGSTHTFFFRDRGAWPLSTHAGMEMTVTGLLSEPTRQVYFAPALAEAFLFNGGDVSINVQSQSNEAGRGDYLVSYSAVLFPDAALTGDEARISASVTDPLAEQTGVAYARLWGERFSGYGSKVEVPSEYGFNKLRTSECSYDLSKDCVMVSPEMYRTITMQFGYRHRPSMQASLYMLDYAYTDDVLAALHTDGRYLAVSPFRVSSLTYDRARVQERLITLGVAAGAFIALFLLEIVVLCAFLRFKIGDFAVLRSLGMDQVTTHALNLYELTIAETIALLAAAAVIFAASLLDIPYLENLFKYYRWYHVLILLLCNALAARLLCARVNRDLDRSFAGRRRAARAKAQ